MRRPVFCGWQDRARQKAAFKPDLAAQPGAQSSRTGSANLKPALQIAYRNNETAGLNFRLHFFIDE